MYPNFFSFVLPIHQGLTDSGQTVRRLCLESIRPRIMPHFPSGAFSRSCRTRVLKIGTLLVTLSGTLCYRASARIGWPSLSILWLGECDVQLLVQSHIQLSKQTCPWDIQAFVGMLSSQPKNEHKDVCKQPWRRQQDVVHSDFQPIN